MWRVPAELHIAPGHAAGRPSDRTQPTTPLPSPPVLLEDVTGLASKLFPADGCRSGGLAIAFRGHPMEQSVGMVLYA